MTNDKRGTPRFLEGSRIYLRPLEDNDADGPYLGWLNDEAVCAGNSHHVFPYTRRRALDYIQSSAISGRDVILAMILKENGRHIGNIALTSVHPLYRTAQFSILLGDRCEWSKGYGLEAGRLMFNHGFLALNLARIECGTFATNTGMRELALSLGMKEEGVRRRAAWKNGEYIDIVEFGILREEFSAAP